jgi:L-threonylcarbamoyladenylate synthase
MKTLVLKVSPRRPSAEKIRHAAETIRAGRLVAFPTETVYGLGADALSQDAAARIYAAKGRPQDNPLIVHVASTPEAAALVLRFTRTAETLAEKFWPGPLTLVLPKAAFVPDATTAGLKTVAVRMPDHPVALALIRKAATPVAAPSANKSGKPSPTTAAHVLEDLAGRVDVILDGGAADIGLESTVLDLTKPTPTVLRPGGVTVEMLEDAVGKVLVHPSARGAYAGRPESPGMRYRHYAPKAALILVEGFGGAAKEKAMELARASLARGVSTGILAHTAGRRPPGAVVKRLRTSGEAGLYRALREFDAEGAGCIVAESVPERGMGLAVMNRLRKAATKIVKVKRC